jgi:hypothetical protein
MGSIFQSFSISRSCTKSTVFFLFNLNSKTSLSNKINWKINYHRNEKFSQENKYKLDYKLDKMFDKSIYLSLMEGTNLFKAAYCIKGGIVGAVTRSPNLQL